MNVTKTKNKKNKKKVSYSIITYWVRERELQNGSMTKLFPVVSEILRGHSLLFSKKVVWVTILNS